MGCCIAEANTQALRLVGGCISRGQIFCSLEESMSSVRLTSAGMSWKSMPPDKVLHG